MTLGVLRLIEHSEHLELRSLTCASCGLGTFAAAKPRIVTIEVSALTLDLWLMPS